MNAANDQGSRWSKFFFSLGILLAALFMGGMYLVNYAVVKTAAWSLLAGIIVLGVFTLLRKKLGGISILFALGGVLSILCAVLTISLFANRKSIGTAYIRSCGNLGEASEIRSIKSYQTEIELIDQTAGVFKAKSFITYDREEYICEIEGLVKNRVIAEGLQKNLPEIEVSGTPVGYFLNEVTVPMNKWEITSDMDFSSKGISSVSIENLPYQAFYDADLIDQIKTNEYMGRETISWDEDHAYSSIRFVYIRPPFHNLRPIITPMIEFSKFDNKLLAVIGFLIPFVLFSIISPVVVNYFQNTVRGLIKKPIPIVMPKTKNPRKINRN